MAKAISIFKYREFNKASIELLLNKELWFAKPQSLNDPFECELNYELVLEKIWRLYPVSNSYRQAVDKKLRKQLIKVGICAFSKTRQNQLMWSHYSDQHKGFCIGFKKQILDPHNKEYYPLDVKYQSELPYKDVIKRLELYNEKNPSENTIATIVDDIMYSAIRTKYSNWKYEREIRLVKEQSGAFKFSSQLVNSIAFGLRMSKRDKSTLRHLMQGDQWKHVKFYQAEKSPNKYGLVFKLSK